MDAKIKTPKKLRPLVKKKSRADVTISTPLPYPFPGNLAPKFIRTVIETPDDPLPPIRPRTNLPAWDRVVDAVYHQYRHEENIANDASLFNKCLRSFLAQHQRRAHKDVFDGSYETLPDSLRFRICRHLMSSHSKAVPTPICLSHRATYSDAWRPEDFSSLSSLLRALDPYLRVSFGFWADVTLTVLMTEHFHLTYSPFVNTYFNPLSTHWHRKYGRYMRNVILEIDLTRFGCGNARSALKLRAGTVNLDTLIKSFVAAQRQREGCANMRSLLLLCRRFYGCRLAEKSDTGREQDDNYKVPFCPDEALRVCDPIVQLRGLVDSVRLCGFSDTYTHSLIHGLFDVPGDADQIKHHSYRVTPSIVWPRLPGQSSVVDSPGGKALRVDHGLGTGGDRSGGEDGRAPSPAHGGPRKGPVQLPAPYVTTRGSTFLSTPTQSLGEGSMYSRSGSGSVVSGRNASRSINAEGDRTRKASLTESATNLREQIHGALKKMKSRPSLAYLRGKASKQDLGGEAPRRTFIRGDTTQSDGKNQKLDSQTIVEEIEQTDGGSIKVVPEADEKMRSLKAKSSRPDLKTKSSRPQLRKKSSTVTLRGMASKFDLRGAKSARSLKTDEE